MLIGGLNLNKPLHLEKSNIILDLVDGNYIPVIYKKGDNWVRVMEGDVIFDWIIYVKTALRSKNPMTHQYDDGFLFSAQWEMSICIINILVESETKWIDIEIARQFGNKFAPQS